MPIRSIKFYLIIFVIILAAAAGVWFLFNREKADKAGESKNSSLAIFNEGKDEKVDLNPSTSSASAQTKKYENAQYGFSFRYPDSFAVTEFPEEEDNNKATLIVKNVQTSQTIQIYITEHNDPNFSVSSKRIKNDIPDLPVSNSADVVVGGKAKGVAFFSQNQAFGGETAEVWFAAGKNFYQATAFAKDTKMLEDIVKSWKFR